MKDDILSALHDLRSRGLSEEEMARAVLDLTLQAAPPDVADAARVCALPAWFDAGLLAFLAEKEKEEAAALLEQIAAFSFVLPREDGGYVYHEATRARLLDWWQEPEHGQRFAALSDRLARPYLALAREQSPRLSSPDYLDALAVLDDAYPNLQAAWEGVVTSENWELVRGFAYTLADYFRHRGLWAEWIAWRKAGLDACERTDDTESYAGLQNNLGNAYANLPTGDRAANLEQAIQCYREALRFRTPEAAPLDYAQTQNNLGNAYANLPTGDRAANLEQAIQCYQEALRFWTPEAAPLAYATTQDNLGSAYQSLPTGDRAANLEQAIQCYQEALRFRTPEAAPLDYAMTQNNLGSAYQSLPTGDRAANLEQAIQCYREALRFYTPEAAPLDYAMTQNNLGIAYAGLPTGDRAANLEQAIQCYREALRFYTPEAAPLDYAQTQNNLGEAYRELPTGDRAANLEQAIACYTAALQVEYLLPSDQAMYHRNRAEALIRLDHLDEAERDCEQAHALAPDHPYTHVRLGQLAFARDDYSAAVEHYSAAIDRQPQADFYFDRGLAHLAWGHPDQALADYQAAIPLADSITIAEALEELNEFATAHPDTPGLDAVRALFLSSS